jgi:threonine/homoserine/homoserine lactone efflux protein
VPPFANVPVFVVAALGLLLIPGPAVLYITARSASQGPRAGLVSMLGIHTGTVVHVLAAVAGLSAVLVASATAFSVVKVAGAAYLVVLGIRTILGHRASRGRSEAEPRALRRLYLDGVLVNVLNPKTALFFLAFLPQFVEPERGGVWSQTLVLGLLFMLIGMITDGTYALAGARIGRWWSRRRASRGWGPFVEGGILVALGLSALAVPHRRTTA